MSSSSHLSLGQADDERGLDGSRAHETTVLKGDYRAWMQSQRARVLVEVAENVGRVEKANHGHASGDVHRVDVVAIDERIVGRRRQWNGVIGRDQI